MMKKFIYTAIAILFMIAGQQASAQKTTAQSRPVSSFDKVASAGPFQVQVVLNGTESVRVTGDEDVLQYIETVVEKETLQIRLKKDIKWDRNIGKVEVYVTAKSLNTLINSGSGSIKVDGTINTDHFKTVMSGSGSISTDIKTKDLHAVLSGSGFIKLSGSAQDASMVVTGSGQVLGKSLGTEKTSTVITGSGQVYVAADKHVSAHITGSGQVIYTGNAEVESRSIGSGKVTKAN
ncbi:head GIN domain-containing protein [Mucilaginibacter sp. PAMB04274]|uniref:head GIN domain-containing protein n=1 Tax=Mucilaginibacter sp. PAMB04274 TaxID=3138568 RepID=UPI0031F6E08F